MTTFPFAPGFAGRAVDRHHRRGDFRGDSGGAGALAGGAFGWWANVSCGSTSGTLWAGGLKV